MKWRLLAQLALLALVDAKHWSVSELPDPSPGRVCDPEGLLYGGQVEAAIATLEKDYEIPGCGGYEMAVVAVRRILNGGDEQSAEDFAKAVLDKWGIGKAACNNGIVLVIAVDDRKMFIATGRGAKDHISNAELTAIIDRMKSLLREQLYAEAAEQAVSDIAQVLSGHTFVPAFPTRAVGGIAGFIALVFGYSTWSGQKKRRRYEDCRKKLTKLEQERAEAKSKQYVVTSCAICLEDFADTPNLEQDLLICGHKFHKECMNSWQDKSTCPICRKPLTEAAASAASGASAALTTAESGTVHSRFNSADDEFRFRLERMHRFYPDYVTRDMMHRWSGPGYTGQLVADTSFIRNSPSYSSSQPGRTSYSNFGSSNFGGGSSSGGGGAGGGW
mmetsp:Transcript_63224/g.137506  ORF Transcript_63224/g.137506 Transcript_63224/m.137506 type:complete len:388 (+) Transcript_63224:66-1229(+)